MSLAAALAAASHHSAQQYGAPRAQKRPLQGMQPERLSDAQEPQGVLEHPCPACGAPSLPLPVLADSAADGVDSSSLQFLTASALEARREEEEEKKKAKEEREERLMQVIHRKVCADQPVTDAEWAAWRVAWHHFLLLVHCWEEEEEEEEATSSHSSSSTRLSTSLQPSTTSSCST